MQIFVFVLFLISAFFLRLRARKSNYFRERDGVGSKRFQYWRKSKTRGYISIALLCIFLSLAWLSNRQLGLAYDLLVADHGIPVMLPPKVEPQEDIRIKERNILNVLINSHDLLMVEEEVVEIEELKSLAKSFISNNGVNSDMSENPQKAVISLKTDRGTSYEFYVEVRDILQLAYNELRSEHVGLSLEEYFKITDNLSIPANKELYNKAKNAYPVMISDAEPSDTSE